MLVGIWVARVSDLSDNHPLVKILWDLLSCHRKTQEKLKVSEINELIKSEKRKKHPYCSSHISLSQFFIRSFYDSRVCGKIILGSKTE